jgi:uncharacterized damage-inducible protein DinB
MVAVDIIILNFEEIRRRSIKLWKGLPDTYFHWRPDKEAMTCIQMVRHVLEGEHLFHVIIQHRGDLGDYRSPWEDRPFTDLEQELSFAEPYRNEFLKMINTLSPEDLHLEIHRKEKNQKRKLGDYLLRVAYHEAIHTGQMLSYYRAMGIERPLIWD